MSAPLPNSYPLTPTQHGMLFNCIRAPHSGVDLEQMVASLRHELDVAAFERGWARVMREHPVLHSRFSWVGRDKPIQEVVPELALPFVFHDLELSAVDVQRSAFDTYLTQDRHDGFDFAQGPLFRVALFRLAQAEYRLVFSYSHSILDGCVSAVIREVFDAYDRIRLGEPPVFEPRTPYREHVLWLEQHLATNAGKAATFFRTLLSGFSLHTKLAVERPPSAPAEPGYENHFFTLTRDTSHRIRALSKQHALNPPLFIEAAWALILGAFSGEDDVVFGYTRECRRSSVPGATKTIGLFINTLPVRADVSAGTPLLTLLARLREQQLAIRDFEQTPLVDVLAEAEVPRGTPLFETIIVYSGYHNNTLMRSWGGDFERREFDFIDQTSFPLSLMVYADDTIHFKLSFDQKRFDASMVVRIADALKELLAHMCDAPSAKLGELPRVSASERRLLSEWNETAAPYERTCIHSLFETQVRRTPERVALAFREQTLSFAELNHFANVLAQKLQAAGVGPDVRVGIFVERGFEMMVALLAILKAGGAYVPMDPSYPRERLAMMLEDASAPLVVTLPHLVGKLPQQTARVVTVDLLELGGPEAVGAANVASAVGPDNLAYVIFTSGSTGRPKGVMIEHGNVANFFRAMDARIGADPPGRWLAVTSISFDISVLELFWTLARGFTVVLQESIGDAAFASAERVTSKNPTAIDFSLFYFAANSGKAGKAQYNLLIEGAKFADRNGFLAVWTPERHFHAFGGLYPNPSLTSTAIAMVTERIQLRAGSVVLPLHNPIRCAEEWSVVDNLSEGRVGLSFASGWHANDFALAPDNFAERRNLMWQGIETIRALFRGEAVRAKTGDGNEQMVTMYPPSVQKEPKIWITAGGSAETFTLAGKMGANILTNLLVMTTDELIKNIRAYRTAFAAAGHTGNGHVTLMLHTFVGNDIDDVRERVRGPFMEYLRTSTALINKARWELTAFARRDKQSAPVATASLDLADLSAEETAAMMAHAFERYFKTTGLFGTPESCLEMVDRLKEMGVSEIACLIDFGVDEDAVLASLVQLNELRKLSNAAASSSGDYSIAAQMRRYQVTHLQCTPSLASMLAADPESLALIGTLDKLMLGGEALPTTLLDRLAPVLSGSSSTQLLNMYGPTETTIWSTTAAVDPAQGKVTLGRPIANTEVYVTDPSLRPCPIGVPGELLIGGAGVARGYLERPDLSAERFVRNPFRDDGGARSERLYRTGDLARFLSNGALEFLGRIDHQVKIRGYRIELGEIETLLARHPSVEGCVVVAQTQATSEASGDSRLIAYVVAAGSEGSASSAQGPALADSTQDWQSVWNETYLGQGGSSRDATFDTAGWASSYTGEPIPEHEMREWLKHGVARILSLSPSRVLEIGCGTGMLLYRIAPHTTHYTALDFSPATLARISPELASRGLSHVELLEKRADQLGDLPRGAYDTVILNSVVQYFPDVAYFVRVVEDVLALLSPGGSFFIGDVRSLPLLEAFHTAIELERASDDMSCDELRTRVAHRIARERELVLAPALFDLLRSHFSAVADVTIQLKPGAYLNEITRFRYDVAIRKRKEAETDPIARASAVSELTSVDALRAALSAGAEAVRARDLPNARLLREVKTVELLHTSQRNATVGALRDALKLLPGGVDPGTAYALVEELPSTNVGVSWAASGAADHFDVAVVRHGRAEAAGGPAATPGMSWEACANRPVRPRTGDALPAELRGYLREHLPEFMIPSAFVLLSSFPLTPNGKIDRKALPEPDRAHRASSEVYSAPSTDLERRVAAVWQVLLGLPEIGVRDNFFDLGANSFLMVQASTRLREVLGIPVSLVDLFQCPSVSALAAHLADHSQQEIATQEGKERAQVRQDAMQRRRVARARPR